MQIKVSFIITVYNVEKYIEKCVRSAMNQTLQEIEIIVINDGSLDNGLKIVEKLCLEDSRIILINQENKGVSAARNKGVKIARGEFIQHLDGDDWIERNASEVTYEFALKETLDIVYTGMYEEPERDDNKNTQVIYTRKIILPDQFFTGKECIKYILTRKISHSITDKLIKTSLHKHVLFPVGVCLGEDVATLVKLSYKAEKLGVLVDTYLLHYNKNNDSSLTSEKSNKYAYQMMLGINEIRVFLEAKNDFEKYKKDYNRLLERKTNSFVMSEQSDTDTYKAAEQIYIRCHQELGNIDPHACIKSTSIRRNENGGYIIHFILK